MIKYDSGSLFAHESLNDGDLEWVKIPSERVTCYLNSIVEFDNTTLGDILCLFLEYPILGIVFPRYDFIRDTIEKWVADGKPHEDMKPDGQDDVTHLWVESIVEFEETDFTFEHSPEDECDDDSDEFRFNDFKKIKTDLTSSIESFTDLTGKSDSGTSFSMSLTPLRQMLHLPITAPGGIQVSHVRSLMSGHDTEILINCNKWTPTFYEFMTTIIDDLTFYGGETDKEEVTSELMSALDEIQEIEKKNGNDDT